jgi:hypothetical protein
MTSNYALKGQVIHLLFVADHIDLQWNNILDIRSPFKLLYSLKIIVMLIEDPTDLVWKTKFMEHGGLQFLLNAYLNRQQKELHANYGCLALIFKMLVFFLTGYV